MTITDLKVSDAKPQAGVAAAASAYITFDELCREMKISPRDARMLLRLAAKQKGTYPNLGKDHVARQPWQWATDSKALAEAKKALATTPDAG
jgi:hypothetical protein